MKPPPISEPPGPEGASLGPDRSERATARRAKAGDGEAWAGLVEDHWNRAFQVHALATDDPRAARMLTEATFELARKQLDAFLRDDEPFSRWLTGLCRDTARARLAEDDWNATPWAQSSEVLSDPPQARPLDPEALHRGPQVPDEAIRTATLGLSLGHKLFARLVFVEGFPTGRLAGVLAASSAFVTSFAYGLLDQLGALETLEFSGEATPAGISLATDALEARSDADRLKELLRRHAGCEGSRTLLFRVIRLSEALSRDPLPAVEAPADLLAALRAGPDAAGGAAAEADPERRAPPRVIPLRHRPEVRGRQDRWMQWAFAATILLFFTGGTYALFGGRVLAGRRPLGVPEAEPEPADTSRLVGYYTSLNGRRQVLGAGRALHASPLGATAVTFLEGPRALLTAGSGMLGHPGRAELLVGKLLVYPAGPGKAAAVPFVIAAGGLEVTAPGATVAVSTGPGAGTLVAVKGGSGRVRLPDGTVVELDPFRQVRVAPDGTYRVEDAGTAGFGETLEPAFAAVAGPAAGSGAGGARAGAAPRYLIAGGSRDGGAGATGFGQGGRGTAGGGSDAGSPGGTSGGPRQEVMIPGPRVRPGTVRGFRDAF